MSSKRYKFSSELSFEVQVLMDLCIDIDTPVSLGVYLRLKNGCWEEISDLSIDPRHYKDASTFADDYLVVEALRKSPNLPLGIDLHDRALEAFLMSEFHCFAVNNRLLGSVARPDWFHSFRKRIDKVLGSLSKALPEIESSFQHGPGASTGVRGTGSVPSDKYDGSLHLTAELVPFFKAIVGPSWHDYAKGPHTVVEGSKFTSVPKTSKTNRGICIEPTLNIYCQKGLGTYIRRRLRRFGLDLDRGELRNTNLVRVAYKRQLATIDLSAASDSVSWALIYEALPSDWFDLFDLFRSKKVLLDDGYHDLEKWSSMGNGYTFELESLLFFCLVQSIVPSERHDDIAVFGDDIIVPQEYATDLVEALNFLGFSVNARKSFLDGSFFESCGADYFQDSNVRPFYMKGSSRGIPYSLQIANKLRLYASRRLNYLGCDGRFKDTWVKLFLSTPKSWRDCKVPQSFGDSGIIDESPCYRKSPSDPNQLEVRQVSLLPRKRRKSCFSVLLNGLSHMNRGPESELSGSASYGRESVRGYLGKPRTRWSPCNRESSGLAWISF